ncbi:hypothetical protein Micbo1qcDRAFT_18690 [Microdochium bolleyi]|uniref:MOSC domain-containing protein n=1 Tax=Microdochium bolleyi TaxID=196109 RepID=A0A136ITC9_9PEZI|nr:hypothetical protein Micbo1qcDRAFT_18690 [Microdochium bolleyi]
MDNLDASTITGIAVASAIAVTTGFFFYNSDYAPDAASAQPSDDIIALRIYPIKSCRGIQVQSAKLLRTGLDLDRNWMLISAEKREFLTIRSNSQMTLIRTAVDFDNDTLTITIEGKGDWKLTIPAHPTTEWLEGNTTLRGGVIWGQETDGWEYPAATTQPLSEFLGVDARLLYKGPSPRVLRGCGAPERLGRTEATKFADMMPVLVASQASLDELNERLRSGGEEAIDIERFRPNIVIRGHKPWSEDNWKTLRIGKAAEGGSGGKVVDLDVVCRCLRCQVPNVDPDSGEKHLRQPWDQLMKYRRIDKGLKFKPSFGMLCVPKEEGVVEVGQKLDVTGTTDSHFFISPMK